MRRRLTLRWRLALLYGGLLGLVAAVLLGLSAYLVDRAVAATASFAPGTLVRVTDASGQEVVTRAEDLSAALREQAVDVLLRSGAVVFALVVLAGAAAGYVVAARALRPVARITATAHRLSTETLAERIGLTGPRDELRELADTFDEMLDRLEAAFDSQRRFAANASHELRTPLAVMRTEVDVALADPDAGRQELTEMGERVRSATERADALVDSLLVLASTEAQARQGLDVRQQIDLATAATHALAALRPDSSERGLRVEADLHPACTTGDPRLLERMVGNLLENAVRHNVEGGWLRVQTGTGPDWVGLAVVNSGLPIDSATAAELFQPFRRGGAARAGGRGAGLGLSIVRAVVTAHGGAVTAVPRESGGLAVDVRLPAG